MKDNEVTDSTFAFRVLKKDKDWISKELDRLKEKANEGRPSGTRVINKNDILLEALKLGFDRLKAKYK
jgi:hypothetical protein